MDDLKRLIPDGLTYLRALCVPSLWVMGLLGAPRAVGFVLAAAAATDVLDGRLSRRWGVTSSVGSRVDAIADTGMGISALGVLLLLEPDVVRDHPIFFTLTPLIAVALLLWGYRVLGKVADLHMTSGRAAGVAAYIFLVVLFITGHRVELLLYVVMALCWLLVVETFVAIRTRGKMDVNRSPLLTLWASVRRCGTGGSSTG